MAITQNAITAYEFGFKDTSAPSGIDGFVCRKAEIRYEPEVNATATNGDGAVESVVVSKKAARKITASFTGYVTADFNGSDVASTGVLTFQTKSFIVKTVSVPRSKGEFVEVTIEAEHNPYVWAASNA